MLKRAVWWVQGLVWQACFCNKPSAQGVWERRDQGCSGITRVKTHLVSEQRVYSAVHGEGRGGSGGGHVGKAAGARCGRILFLVQHAYTNTFMNLPLAPLSTDGLLRRSNRQAGMCYICTQAWGGDRGISQCLYSVCARIIRWKNWAWHGVEGNMASVLGSSCRNGRVAQFIHPSTAKGNSGAVVSTRYSGKAYKKKFCSSADLCRPLLFFPISLSKLVSQTVSLFPHL